MNTWEDIINKERTKPYFISLLNRITEERKI